MTGEEFLSYVAGVDWRFARSVPNWPHFYIVEEELDDQEAFRAARLLIRDSGRDGRFFSMKLRYYDADGWTYWSSPLAEPFEAQYMLNRCRTEFTYESLAASGALPAEGFEEASLNLAPILKDPDFKILARDSRGGEVPVSDDRCGELLKRHAKTFHALPFMLGEESVKSQCGDAELNLLKLILGERFEGG